MLILGPMASGKSIALIAELDRYKHADMNSIMVHSSFNVRDDDVTTRLGVSRDSLKVRHLSELAGAVDLSGVEAVGIDEAFMFDDAEDTFETIKGWLGEGKDVFAASLDVMANGSMSPTIKRLLELVPDVRYVRAACEIRSSEDCDRKNARFTMIFEKEGKPIPRDKLPDVIPDDGSVIYKPACRRCYYGLGTAHD